MPHLIDSNDDFGCIFIRWRGTFSSEEGRAYYQEVSELENFRNGATLFHDVRLVDVAVPADEIRTAATLPTDLAVAGGERKVAILAPTDFGFGMMRMLAAFRETPGVVVNVFRELDDAKAWLELPDEIGDPFEAMLWD